MKRYKYLLNGSAQPNHSLNRYKLYSKGKALGKYTISCIRIEIPSELELEYHTDGVWCGYYSNESTKSIKDYTPVIMLKINGHWKENKYLTDLWLNSDGKFQPYQINEIVSELPHPYYAINGVIGYGNRKHLEDYKNKHLGKG